MPSFPAGLEPVDDLSPAAWVEAALKDWPAGRFRVRHLIPPVFEAYARILHRPYRPQDGRFPTGSWAERADLLGISLGPETGRREIEGPRTQDLDPDAWTLPDGSLNEGEIQALVSLLGDYTSMHRCWFAIWSGWGDLSGGSSALYRTRGGTIADLRIRWRNRLESWQARREAARLKTFSLLGQSGRSYLLLSGSVRDAERFHFEGGRFQSPTIWWPVDRSWLVHTEIDAVSTFVGGARALIDELVGEQVLESFELEADDLAAL